MSADSRIFIPLFLALTSIAALALSAALMLALGQRTRLALSLSVWSSTIANGLGIGAGLLGVAWGAQAEIERPWTVPVGSLHVGIDPLSSFFLVCIHAVALLAALFGADYLRASEKKGSVGPTLFFFNCLVLCMALLVLARDGILFLVAWETMFLSSYFLVTRRHDLRETRNAGFVYLIASHIGVLFLFLLFALLSGKSGSFDFRDFQTHPPAGAYASACFALAVLGFGIKAGLWPLHIWLPDAHPAAPTHVSALMSGAMIEMGIYGLFRFLPFCGPPEIWWGVSLIAIGSVSGVLGILNALAQKDLKRLLAYSSVENMGVIALGIGIGLLGRAEGEPAVEVLGFAGAALHTLNHGLFKGLLFQGAGAVLSATGSKSIEVQGGLLKRMPVTGMGFLVGSAAASGLPLLNGFIGELLIFLAAFRAVQSIHHGLGILGAVFGIASLAFVGGLASACFVRTFGVVFLGEPRREAAGRAVEAPSLMRLSMATGAIACIAIGLWPAPAVELTVRALGKDAFAAWTAAGISIGPIVRLGAALVAAIAGLSALRRLLVGGKTLPTVPTWGCGYESPTPRMQYTGTSFSDPLLAPFSSLVPRDVRSEGPEGHFPLRARWETTPVDLVRGVALPAFRLLTRQIGKVRALQMGKIQVYLTYILITLLFLLIWQFMGGAR